MSNARKSIWVSLAAALIALGTHVPAAAQSLEQNAAGCRDGGPVTAIRSCTALIQSGREKDQDLASDFDNRGVAYKAIGKYDLALADYQKAIALSPDAAAFFKDRGPSIMPRRNSI